MEVTTKRWKEWSMCRLYLVEWHQMTSKSNTTRPQHRSQQHTSFAWYTPGWKFHVLWSCRQYQRWFFIKTTSSEIGLPFYPRKKKSTLKTMYHAFIHTKMDYAALARKHWLSKTKMTRMESCQSCALCLATRKLISTPNEALQMEAKVQSYTTISQRNILKAKEKSLCWAADHLKLTFHCGFLHVPAGGEKQLSYPIYFLTSSTNINKLVCSLPLHGSYQPLKDTTT